MLLAEYKVSPVAGRRACSYSAGNGTMISLLRLRCRRLRVVVDVAGERPADLPSASAFAAPTAATFAAATASAAAFAAAASSAAASSLLVFLRGRLDEADVGRDELDKLGRRVGDARRESLNWITCVGE